ncbi:hypothetical protein CAJAP_11195 [Camponotus japonicus]
MSEATRDRDHFAVYLQSEWGISMCLSNYISFVISRFTLVVPQFGRTLHKEAWQPTDLYERAQNPAPPTSSRSAQIQQEDFAQTYRSVTITPA